MTSQLCPTCGQVLPQAKGRRICADCKKPIRRHDKWFIGGDGKLHHKDCNQPEGVPVAAPLLEVRA
jgi:predicted amidophosphoribosyltransferase